MRPLTRAFLPTVACSLLLVAAPLGAQPIAVANPGFEDGGAGVPARWTVAPGAPAASTVTRDASQVRSGGASVLLSSPAPTSLTLVSEPLRLVVGRLYRLRAWVRTEGAFADPLSRYPTAVAACATMASFPFTNHSPAAGADTAWSEISVPFIATKAEDRVRLHLGHNGTATGMAWFDDVTVEAVDDVAAWVAPETVRWFGPAYRYDDRGWIFVHIEGEPYQRGYQYGALLADEIVAYATKLGYNEDHDDSTAGWRGLRGQVDALFLRGFDDEYLVEMRGIADGAAHAGAKLDGKAVDLLDVVTLNSAIDLGQLRGATNVTPTRALRPLVPQGRGRAAARRAHPQVLVVRGQRPRHRRRSRRFRPDLHVGRVHRRAFQRVVRRRPDLGSTPRLRDVPRRHPLRRRLLHQRRRHHDRRDHHRADAVRHHRHAAVQPHPQGGAVRPEHRRRRQRSCGRRTTASTPTTGRSPTRRPTRLRSTSSEHTRRSCGAAATTRSAPPASCGRTTTTAISACARSTASRPTTRRTT